MLLDMTSAEEILELLDPDLKDAIDYEFSRGEEEHLLKTLLKNLDEYIHELNAGLSPLTGLLEPFSGIFYQSNLTQEIIDFWKPKRVRLHSIDNIYTFNNPLEDSVRYDDWFDLTEWHEYAYDSEYVTDGTAIDIAILIYEHDRYNEHPGHYETVEQSPERLADGTSNIEWQAGGFTPFDGPIDSTTGIDDPWLFDAPFGCDFCHIQLYEFTDTTSNFSVAVSSDDYYWTPVGTPAFSNVAPNIYMGRPGAGSTEWAGGFRFPNVNIQQGATIVSAYLRVKAHWTESGVPCDVKVYGNDVDNAVAPLNKAQADLLTLTTNFDNVTLPIFFANTWYIIDCTQAVQEVVNRLGWVPLNALQIIIKDNTPPTGQYQRQAKSIDSGAANKAELHIEWLKTT
jgi:hypothetical protein